jgi:hypothetical protein
MRRFRNGKIDRCWRLGERRVDAVRSKKKKMDERRGNERSRGYGSEEEGCRLARIDLPSPEAGVRMEYTAIGKLRVRLASQVGGGKSCSKMASKEQVGVLEWR